MKGRTAMDDGCDLGRRTAEHYIAVDDLAALDVQPAVFDDDQIASILTYVRREWGHTASPVEPGSVKSVRAETEKREEAWSEAELLKIP